MSFAGGPRTHATSAFQIGCDRGAGSPRTTSQQAGRVLCGRRYRRLLGSRTVPWRWASTSTTTTKFLSLLFLDSERQQRVDGAAVPVRAPAYRAHHGTAHGITHTGAGSAIAPVETWTRSLARPSLLRHEGPGRVTPAGVAQPVSTSRWLHGLGRTALARAPCSVLPPTSSVLLSGRGGARRTGEMRSDGKAGHDVQSRTLISQRPSASSQRPIRGLPAQVPAHDHQPPIRRVPCLSLAALNARQCACAVSAERCSLYRVAPAQPLWYVAVRTGDTHHGLVQPRGTQGCARPEH